MTDKQIKILADKVWKQIADSYHWGDEFTSSYNYLHSALRKAAGK